MIDIFDLENQDDLNDSIRSELKINKDKINKNDRQILELFSIKNKLTIDEIIVGLARKSEIVRKKSWLVNRLYHLAKMNKIERIEKGLYCAVVEEDF